MILPDEQAYTFVIGDQQNIHFRIDDRNQSILMG